MRLHGRSMNWMLVSLAIAVWLCAPAHANGMASGDFNGDGCQDLAIGVPDEDIAGQGGAIANAGAVNILYGGSAAGLSAAGNEFLYQGGPDVADAAQAGDRFGYSLAVGDFNGDKYDDLAVGVPGQKVGLNVGAGAAHVFYGSPDGFIRTVIGVTQVRDQVWHRDSAGVLETAASGDSFGWSLAAGDFNGDKYDDLAVGVPYDDPGALNAGSIHILHGSSAGVVAADAAATLLVNENNQVWHQDSGEIRNVSEPEDHFGWSLAAGDFNDDGCDDLAIGVPGESIGPGIDPAWNAGPQDAGAVNVLEGSDDGLTDFGNQTWHQRNLDLRLVGLLDRAEADDSFGWSLAAGDFNDDGRDDLAIGVPGEDDESNPLSLSSRLNVGAVHVIYGSEGGLWFRNEQFWHQDSSNADGAVADAREAGDMFGLTLAAGDLDNNGCDDLIVGVPFEDVPVFGASRQDAGAVNVLYGRAGDGVHLAGNQMWHQDSASVLDTSESGDQFSTALAVGDFNGDGFADLAVGVPGEGITSGGVFREHAGAVNVLHGTSVGLGATNLAATTAVNEDDQLWHQNSANVEDFIENHDHFGGRVAL